MIHYELHECIDRLPEAVFDFVGSRYLQNHPLWEPAVLEVRQSTPGPIGTGTQLVMVRRDAGRVHEVPYEVVKFLPGRMIALRTLGGPLELHIAFTLSAAEVGGTDLSVRVEVEPRGFLRLLTPVMARQMPKDGAKMLRCIKQMVEAELEDLGAGQLGCRGQASGQDG